MNINDQESYNQVLCDLFEAALNIIKGISSITTSTANGFTEYRIHSPDNCPGILITYENIRKPEHICVYPMVFDNYFITSFSDSTLSVGSKTVVTDEATLEGEQIQVSDGQLTRSENKCGYYNYFETHDVLPSARIIQEPLITNKVENLSKSNNGCTIKKGNKTDGLKEDSEMTMSTCSSGQSMIGNMKEYELNKSNCSFSSKNPIQSDINESQKLKRKKQKEYSYEYCEQPFSKSFDKIKHERIHTGDKHFMCNYCGKKFRRLAYAKRHERIHTGEKRYSCSYCNKVFTHTSTKSYHERIHTGKKPYKCAFCERTFTRSCIKNNHERVHTGEKPYSCNFCGKKFAQSSDKRRHERIHIRENTPT